MDISPQREDSLICRSGRCSFQGIKSCRFPALVAGVLLLAVILVYAFTSQAVVAQPVAEWRSVVGGDADEFAHAVALADGGGYVIAGETSSYGSGARDGMLVKLNASGEEIWSRPIGGKEDDVFYDIQKAADGGYILAGETHSAEGTSPDQSDFWLVKTDAEGHVAWERSYGNLERSLPSSTESTSDVAHAVLQARNGDYVLAGSSTGPPGSAVWLLRVSPNGRLLWSRNPGVASGAVAYDIAQTPDGGFALAGSSVSGAQGSEALLIKTDSGGNTEWTQTFGERYNEEARTLVLTGEGGYVLGGFTWSLGSGQSDYWLVKANSEGIKQWERSFGGLARDSAHALIQTSDGGFALAGWSESFSSGDRFWIIKTSSFGSLQWSRAYPQSSLLSGSNNASISAGARAIKQTEDLGFIVVGWTGPIEGARDILAIKTAPIEEWPAAEQGPVVKLENTGAAAITSAAVEFSPVDSTDPGGPLRFWRDGKIVSRNNPLPIGQVACSQPKSSLTSEMQLTFDQIGSFEAIYLDTLSEREEIPAFQMDGSVATFDINSGGRQTSANLSIVSESPCAPIAQRLPEGPLAPVQLNASNSESTHEVIELEWDDNRESEVSGYGIYLASRRSGPFQRIAWMAPQSNYADMRIGDGSIYYYAVSAINLWGLESPLSSVVEVRSVDVTPPNPPTGLKVSSQDRQNGRATLEWNVNPGDTIKGYRLYRQDGRGTRAPITALLFGARFEDWTFPSEGVSTYSVTAIDLAGNESGPSNIAPPQLDFFGSVLDVKPSFTGGGQLLVNTHRGYVEVAITQETEIGIPHSYSASLNDLNLGDPVAVALQEQGSSARQVYLVPASTRNRHFTGLVTEVSESSVVIQPALEESEQLEVPLSSSVKVTLHRGAAGLVPGAFVIVSYTTIVDGTAIAVGEINIVPAPRTEGPGDEPVDETAPRNVAIVRGEFQGINRENANIILSSVELTLNVHTVMENGLSVGEAVFAEAVLLPDGSLLAERVGQDDGASEIATRTTLRGIFQGLASDTGDWLVSGIEIQVDRGTYAESLPSHGERVKVSAIPRNDGSVYARNIQNLSTIEDADSEHFVQVEGIFRGITPGGDWDIGGIDVSVNSDSKLSGRPSLGRRVSVTATYSEGSLLAREVSSLPPVSIQPIRTVAIRGVVGSADEAVSIVVDGISISLSEITKILGEIKVGSTVSVKAEIDAEGALTAREVAEVIPDGQTGETRATPVDIEGRIERLLDDGGLLVNGIPIQISTLTDIRAALQVGASVQVRGLLQRGGSVLARDILGYGPSITGGTEASIEGVISRVATGNEGRVSSFVVDGIPVTVDRLSRLEVEPANGVPVIVQGIVIGGDILAVSVEPQPLGNVGVLPRVQMQGVIEDMPSGPVPLPVDITVNGVTVRISAETQISGSLTGGAVAKVSGRISDGIFLAQEITRITAYDSEDAEPQARFRIRGALQEASLDSDGRPDRLLVSGERIIVESLSEFRNEVFVGDSITVEGVIRDGILVATVITLNENAGEN